MAQHGMFHLFSDRKPAASAEPTHPATSAVIVAAGSSTRMGYPKQLIPLDGIPVIGRTLMAFEAASLVDEIVIVTREEQLLHLYDICKSYEISKVTKIVKGGTTRQQSVREGVYACHNTAEFFAIHDGARPFITPAQIDAVISAAYQFRCAAAGVRVKDTIQQTDEQDMIVATPDRRFLWNVQTPQVMERGLYLHALNTAFSDGLDFTDDCQLIEHVGGQVKLVESSYANIKITTPEDVAFAETLLHRSSSPDTD